VGQKVHPFGFRLGVYEDWNAHWFSKKSYGADVMEDFFIRNYLTSKLSRTDLSKVTIEKAVDNIRVIIHASRPGLVIGKKGQGIDQIKQDLHKKLKKNVDISVQEERAPEVNAKLVAESIAEQLEKRVSFKRLMKKSAFAALKGGAKGIKICCAGRLGGAEIARSEWLRLGSTPLHTLRANVQYALAEAHTIYGIIGVKVWICKGEY
jgi:small subunit ribosomal protein S3